MAGYVIQAAQATATSSPGTVTLPGTIRTGNTLIAMASVRNATTSGTLSSVTLAGAADNFAQAYTVTSATAGSLDWWLDPLCAGGQTRVVFTTAGGTGTEALTMSVLEVGGMIPIPAGPGAVDVSAGTTGTGTVWSSGTTSTTSWPTEIVAAMVCAAGTHTTAPQQWPWVNLTAQPSGTVSITQAAYFPYSVPSSGLGVQAYGGTFSASQAWVSGIATFPCIPFSPVLPDYPAGAGVQQGDMASLATSSLGFTQQRVVFRAAQLTTQTALPSSGALTAVQYDTVYEDPYLGWYAPGNSYTAPYSGWYIVTQTVSVGACPANTFLGLNNGNGETASLVMPTTGGIVQGMNYRFLVAGEAVFAAFAYIIGGSNVQTSNSPGSTIELMWAGFSAG